MKIVRSILIAFAFLFVVSSAHAQTSTVKAAIPFSFVVDKSALPAGDYTLGSILTGSRAVAVRDLDQPSYSVVTVPNACALREPSKTTKLVFHRLGNQYFLYQIWIEGQSFGREFPMSKLEIQMAKNQPKAEEVIVAALLVR